MTIPVLAETYTLYSGQIYSAAFRQETPDEVMDRIQAQCEARMTPEEIETAREKTNEILRKAGIL